MVRRYSLKKYRQERRIDGKHFAIWKRYTTKQEAQNEAKRVRNHWFLPGNARIIKVKNGWLVYRSEIVKYKRRKR